MTESKHAPKAEPLSGAHVALRARRADDIPILHAELYDLATRARADSRPWRPIPRGSPQSPYEVPDADDAAFFSIATVEDGELVGEAVLLGHRHPQPHADVGIALRPGFRRRGWSSEVLGLLCEYGFTVRGLHRLQLATPRMRR